MAVLAVLDADEDEDGDKVVTLALELVENLKLELVDTLLAVVAVGVGLGAADVGAVEAGAKVVVDTAIALDKGGNLGDEELDVLDLDLDEDDGLLILLDQLNLEEAELAVLVGDGALDGDLEVAGRVAVEVALVVAARVGVTLVGELLKGKSALAAAVGLHESTLALKVLIAVNLLFTAAPVVVGLGAAANGTVAVRIRVRVVRLMVRVGVRVVRLVVRLGVRVVRLMVRLGVRVVRLMVRLGVRVVRLRVRVVRLVPTAGGIGVAGVVAVVLAVVVILLEVLLVLAPVSTDLSGLVEQDGAMYPGR